MSGSGADDGHGPAGHPSTRTHAPPHPLTDANTAARLGEEQREGSPAIFSPASESSLHVSSSRGSPSPRAGEGERARTEEDAHLLHFTGAARAGPGEAAPASAAAGPVAGAETEKEMDVATTASADVVVTTGATVEDGNFEPVRRSRYSASFLKKPHVGALPAHLIPLANEIHKLDERDLVLIADLADEEAKTDVYSLLPYTGSNWFLPSIRECREGEPRWGLRYTLADGLLVHIGGRRLSLRLLNILVRVAFLILCWFMLWNALPHWLVEPGGYVWDPCVLIIVSAIVGGLICRILQIPPLVGVLWIGIMWNNIPRLRYLTSGIVNNVFDVCAKVGLTVILARAGYSLSYKGIRPHWKQSLLLATMPFAFEGVAHSLIANKVFEYHDDYNWAFLQGILCSIVSPAVVVPGTLYLQELGYGRGVGPLSLMLSAVGVEIVIGVWAANFIIGLIFYGQKLAVAIALGPVQFIGGTLIGVALGFVYFYVVEMIKKEAQRLPNGKYQRDHFRSSLDFAYAIFLFACFTMVFFGYGVSLAGGGCVMCVFFSATVSHLWLRDGKRELEEQKKYIGSWLACTWDQVMLPVLFATMGARINILAIFNRDFFPKAIICLLGSTAVRMVVIFCVQLGDGMPWKEKLLVCVGYLGKASAQASVGPIAANLVAGMIAKLPPDQAGTLDTWARHANNIQQMSAMYVMFMAAVASLGLVRGGMMVLKREQPPARVPRGRRGRPVAGLSLGSGEDDLVDDHDGSGGGRGDDAGSTRVARAGREQVAGVDSAEEPVAEERERVTGDGPAAQLGRRPPRERGTGGLAGRSPMSRSVGSERRGYHKSRDLLDSECSVSSESTTRPGVSAPLTFGTNK